MEQSSLASRSTNKADGEAYPNQAQIHQLMRELNFKPPCECYRCLRQYRTLDQQDFIEYHYFGRIKDEDVISLARNYTHSIENNRTFLLQQISESGVSILDRWCAGDEERRKFLLEAKPDLYPNRNPLIDIPSCVDQLRDQRKHRMSYMLPYLNVEDLSEDPSKFIGLLVHRTKVLSEEWVPFDHAMLWSGWNKCTLQEKSAHGCIFMYGDRFGQWSTFDPVAVHRYDACGAPRALLILELQQNLMKFLRDLTMVVLDGAKPSNSSKVPAHVSATEPATNPTVSREVNVCAEWLQSSSIDQTKDHRWLSFGAMFSDLPYSAAPSFDIDTLIDIAENQANELKDELWLLQTDLEYFHDRSSYHEATWFDKLGKGPLRQKFTTKEKFDNIGFIMTVKVLIHARDWQWLLEECQIVKLQLLKSGSKIGPGKPLPKEYERALGSLEKMLERYLAYHQMNLKRSLIRSPAFSNVFKVIGTAEDQILGTGLKVDLRDYSTLFLQDRIGWCLYQLTSSPSERLIMEPSAVLQFLDDFLKSCSPKETERIDQEMQRCISELTAIIRMTKILDLHRPSFNSSGLELFLETRGAWRVLNNPVFVLSKELELASFIKPLNKFQMPTGRKDGKWLKRRDAAHLALDELWAKARKEYGRLWKTDAIPQKCIDPQLEWMKQCKSAEHVARLEKERCLIMDRLRAEKEGALARKVSSPQEGIDSFAIHQEADAKYQVPKTLKTKVKTRQANNPESDSLPEDRDDSIEITPPVLYRFKQASVTEKVVCLLFPDPDHDFTKKNPSVSWINFVEALITFGFRAEHRGGSAFTFRGDILLPENTSLPHNRSITVHRPHPNTEMSRVLVQSLGKRLNRRFGWQRANFAVGDRGIGQDT